MHDIIAFLKGAVNRTIGSGIEGCYIVNDGSIYVYNYRTGIQAGIEWPDESAFTIPAEPLDNFLARVKEVTSIKIDDNYVTLRGGRLSSEIKRNHSAMPDIPSYEGEWLRSPPGLTAALDVAKDFLGDRSWTEAVRLMSGRVTAFSGDGGIDVELEGLTLGRPYLLAEESVKFLVAQGDPDQIGQEKNAIWFRWDDGRWVRCQLIDNEMPESSIAHLFDEAGEETPVAVDQEWREALADAAALGDGKVTVTAAGLQVIKENVTTTIDLSIDVDIAHTSSWNAKKLALVIARATAWNPARYPDPSLFVGDGLRGLIVGVR